MARYWVTFDAVGGRPEGYDLVYQWAHQTGGFRYFKTKGGWVGRLPSTTIVVNVQAASVDLAHAIIKQKLEVLMNSKVTQLTLVAASSTKFTSVAITAPDWAMELLGLCTSSVAKQKSIGKRLPQRPTIKEILEQVLKNKK